MRNPAAPGGSVCPICRTFHDPAYETCIACSRQPNNLDAFVPITYSVHAGQMHDALRGYKDDSRREVRRFHAVRLTAILWRFLENHEQCVAAAAGVDRFDLVSTVPSKDTERDEQRQHLRIIVGQWCHPTADRWQRVLMPTDPPILDRSFSEARYVANIGVRGRRVLLIDDTWTTGSAMQSAAAALRQAGARAVAGVVIGRRDRRESPNRGPTMFARSALPLARGDLARPRRAQGVHLPRRHQPARSSLAPRTAVGTRD